MYTAFHARPTIGAEDQSGVIVATRGRPVPAKLKRDAIVEALLEVRFETATIPEVLFGRLADHPPWKSFNPRQLPAYEIPALVRKADTNLRYQPVLELAEEGGRSSIHIGPQVLSYHCKAPYVGWGQFSHRLMESLDCLFERAEGLIVRRLGLRYINALKPDDHGILSISDLDLKIQVANETIAGNVNLNFTTDSFDKTQCTVRVATTEFVRGELPPGTSVIADVDVFTKDGFRTKDKKAAAEWVEQAHSKEKEQFFRLLTDKTIENLEEN